MNEINGNDNGGEFVPINRAAMTKGDSLVQGQDAAEMQASAAVTGSPQVGLDTATRPQEPDVQLHQAKFAANLPEWDLLPPVVPIKRVRRQL